MATVHEMELRVRVRIADLTITEAAARMDTFPHTECPGIVGAFAGLEGLSVTRGYTREVQARFAGPKGCTHLEQLARSLGPVVVQAVTSRRARAVSTGALGRPPLRGREPVGPGLLSHLGRRRDRRPEAGRRLASGHRTVSRPPAGDVHRPGRPPTRDTDPARPVGAGGSRGRLLARRLAVAALVAVTVAVVRAARPRGRPSPRPSPPRRPVLEHGPSLRGQGGQRRRPRPGAGRRPGHHPLPLRDRPPGLAVPVLRHLRRAVAAAHPAQPG